MIVNTILLIACLTQKSLWSQRKFYTLVVTLTLADFFEGLGYVGSGATQLQTSLAPMQNSSNVTQPCITMLPIWPNIFSRIGGIASCTIHLIITVERFFATFFPTIYFQKWKMRHVIGLLSSGYINTAMVFGFHVYLFSFRDYTYDKAVCSLIKGMPDVAVGIFWYQKCIFGVLSFIVGAGIVIVNYFKKIKNDTYTYKRQAIITQTMVIITGVDFAMICIPSVIYLMVSAKVFDCPLCNKAVIILGLMNSSVGFVIYMWKNKDMRKAVIAALCCRRPNIIATTTSTAPLRKISVQPPLIL